MHHRMPVRGNQVKAFAGQPCSGSDHIHEFLLCQYLNTELLRLCQLASGLFPADQVICLFGDGAAGRGAEADPASSTLTETGWENIPVHENDVTTVLMQRWIACYMLYDWNLHHADHAYLSNKCNWVQQTYKRLEGTATDAASLKDTLTDTFNRIPWGNPYIK